MKRILPGLVISLFLLGTGAMAQNVNVGPFYGYRFGGDFENPATGQNHRIDDNPSYGIYFDLDPNDSGLKLEVLYSFQPSSIDLTGISTLGRYDLDVHVMQIGGIQELYDGKFRPYVAGSVGATFYDLKGVGSDLHFSFTLGAGVNYYLTRNLGLRLDVRGFGTVVEDSGGFACGDGGCAIGYAGDLVWQGEATAGVFLSF